MKYVLAYDVGTTGLKVGLYKVDQKIEAVCTSSSGYPLYVLPNGGAEQEADDWWNAMCMNTKRILEKSNIDPRLIEGLSFCSQAQGFILVDKEGVPVHRPMSYMDQRAKEEIKKEMSYGLQVAGANIFKLIPSLVITGAVSSSVKDPMWKYKWLEANEPENFKRGYKWLDVKDYLACRCTGECTMTPDSAFGTLLFDTRKGKNCFSKKMCDMMHINMDLLPRIIQSTDVVGTLTKKAAEELGLTEGTKVFGGGGDNSLIGVGAGTVRVGDTHIYSGTSGWVVTVTDKRMVDVDAMIAAISGPQEGKFNYFAEMETAGKCLEWVRDHLALDEIGVYLEKKDVTSEHVSKYKTLYDYLTETIKNVPPGAGGVIFTPWLHGNRCPFEDPNAMGMFTGIKIETGKTELIAAVLEGIDYHLRWMLECQDRKIKTSSPVRFVGGGALSDEACQRLCDIIGRDVETVDSPQNVGALGAAAICAVGLGAIPSLDDVADFIPVAKVFHPDPKKHAAYEPYYQIFKKLYKTNQKVFGEIAKATEANNG